MSEKDIAVDASIVMPKTKWWNRKISTSEYLLWLITILLVVGLFKDQIRSALNQFLAPPLMYDNIRGEGGIAR